jgi:nucleoside-diphosphate-sugar epimerase
VYGAGGELPKTETDPLDPLTAYAQSKVQAEADLKQYAASDFTVTCLRFATACGPSTRMRLDLVLNDFVATALTERRLVILSDGTPWRPLIDTRDMSNALIWAAERPAENGGAYLAVNAGSDDWNFSILDLAKRVQRFYSGIEIEVNTSAPPDKRSYVVDFSQFQKLAPDVYPKRPLEDSIAAIDRALDHSSHRLKDFRSGPFIRLNVLNNMRNLGNLDEHLRWAHQSAARPN